jgi:C1q domain
MKLKLVIVDLEVPPKVKKWATRVGIPAAVIMLGGGIAWAAGLHSWNDGDTLAAADLNGNFTQLQSEIDALQAQITTTGSGGFGTRAPSAFAAEYSKAGNNVAVPFETATVVAFDKVLYDLGGEYNNTTGKFTAKNPGIYTFVCGFEFSEIPETGENDTYSATLLLNGALLQNVDANSSQTNEAGLGVQVSTIAQLKAGDVVDCAAYSSRTGGTTLDPNASGPFFEFGGARLY